MPDILDQDYSQPLHASDIPKVEPVVSSEPPVVDVQTPVVDKYKGMDRSLEKYDRFLSVKDELSDDEVAQYEDIYKDYDWDANDLRHTLKKKNLAPEQRLQYQTELNKRESMEHISELFLDPSKLVRDLPKHMQDSFAIGYDHSEGPTEDMMKQINQIYLSNVLGKPLNEVAKDWDAIKASFYTYKGEKDLTFDVTSEQAAFNWNKDILHPDTLSSTEAIGVGMSKIRSNWNADDEQKALDELSYNESLLAITNPELVNIDKILEAEANISNTPRMSNDGDNWLTGAWYSAVTMGSRFGSSWYESKEEAMIGAGVGATTALVAGQIGPQALAFEEIATVPVSAVFGFARGFGIGQFDFWRKQGTGAIFREAVKQGVDAEVAGRWAQVGGVLYAAAEKIGGLNKMPLVDKVLKAKAAKIYKTKGITETAAAIGKHVSIQTIKEIGEEGLQKGIQTATVETALYDDGKISDEEYIEALFLKVPEDAVLEMYNVVKDGGIFFFGALSASSINLETRALTPAEQAKADAKYKGMVKSHRKEVDERVSESSKDTSKKEGEVDNAVNDKLSQSMLRYMDENLSPQEAENLNRKLVQAMGLRDTSNMNKEQLMAESEMSEKSSDTSMKKRIIANRAKFILPTANTANFQNFVSAVVPENIAVTHESASVEFGEQIELIQQKVEANIKLTDKEQSMLDIHEEKYVEDIGYGEGLVESVLDLETDTVVEASAQRGIDAGTLTEAEVEQWIADKKADPQAMKLARYIAQNSDAKILFTGKEFTYQNAVDEGMITEEQAYQKLVESGKVSEGMDAHDIALNNALIAGFNMDNVAYISSLGDVTTVIEEISEVYVKSRMKSDSDFVKELESFYNEYAKANPEFNKDTSMVEFFSDRAIEYAMGTDVGFDGASDTMISILDSIKALFDLIVQRALTLNRMIGEGKVSKEMQIALKEAGMPLFKTDKEAKAKSKEDVRQEKVSEVSNVNIEEAEFSETEDELLDDYLAFLDEEENQHLKKVEVAEVDFQTAGIKSKTADETELNKAIELNNNNTPSQEIFEQTGWFKGHDGKWKYEINDDDISFNEVSINQDELVNLSGLINHKGLFKAYPSLDKVQVYRSEEHQAAYNNENNVIFIGNNHFDEKGNIKATDDFTRTLLHEIQHAVQSIEGFASGTNPLGALISVQRKLRELDEKGSLSEAEQGLKGRLELWSSEKSLTTMYSAFAGEVEAESTADRFKSSWRQSIVPTEKTGLGVKPSFYIIADPETNDVAWVGSLVDSEESIDTLKTVQEETDFMTDEVMTEALEELDNSFEDGLVSEDIQQPNELELMFPELTFQTIFSQSDEIESTERAKLISDAKLTRSIQLTEDLANVEGDNTKSIKIMSDFAQKWLGHDDNFGSNDGILGRFEKNYTITQSIPQSLAKTKEAILSRIATKERKEAQARISKKLNKALNETEKAKGRAIIRKDSKGNDKEILVSPEYFEELEKIKAIREMTQEAVDLALQNAIDESDIEQVHRIERWKTQKQDAGASFIAEQILDDMMEAGKVDYMKTVSFDKKVNEAFKQLALDEITGGKDRLKTQVEAKNLDMTKEQRDKYDSIENPKKKARYLSSLMKAKKLSWYKKINLETQTLSSLMDMISQDPSKGMMEGELVNWIELLTQNADDKKDVVIEDMHDQLKDGLKRFLSETEEGLNTLSEQQLDTGIIIRDVEAQISYLDAITLLMYGENEHSKAALKNTGIGAIELKQIEDFVNRYAENHLDEEKKNNIKEFVKWTFDLTSANNANVNKMHKKYFGVPMTFEENYLPLVIKYSSEMDKPENRSANVVSAWHHIKTERVNHEREIDLEGINLLHVLTNHIEDTANFLAKAQAGSQLRKVLTDVDIQAAIAQEFGQEFNTTIKNRITSWEIGEQRRNNNLGSLDKLLRNYTRARIWGKTGNFVKQLTSAIAYTIEMPFDEWAKRSFAADVSEYKTRFDTLKRLSPFLRERLNKGAGSALRTALETNSLYNVLEGESVENKIVRMGMIFTQFGDIGAIVLGGWAVFEYKKEQYLAEGKSPQAAEDAAILDFERFTARTQQSGKSKDISNIQENINPLIKLFVMFQNSQFAYWRTINAAVRALQSGKADKQKAAKALLITGLILPLAFGTATIGNKALWMALTGFGINDDEEERLKQMAFGLLMSPVSGLPSVLGSTAAATVAAFTPLEAPFAGVTPIIDDVAAWSRAPASIKTAADILGVASGLNFKELLSLGQDIYKGTEE